MELNEIEVLSLIYTSTKKKKKKENYTMELNEIVRQM